MFLISSSIDQISSLNIILNQRWADLSTNIIYISHIWWNPTKDNRNYWYYICLGQPAARVVTDEDGRLLVEQNGDDIRSWLPVFVHLWVRSSTDSPQECWNFKIFLLYFTSCTDIVLTLTLVRNEAVVVLRITTFLDQDVNLLSLQLLSWSRKVISK